ncbi:MAG: hypothetical protein ABW044_02870 [Cellvibrio sp.]
MRFVFFMVSAVLITSACTSAPVKPSNTSNWVDFGYEGMAAKINRLAGVGSINCGIRNHIEPDDSVNKLLTPNESKACVKAAMKANTPFRYGSIKIPTDSYLFDALVLSSNGEFWTIKYDYMLDGSGNHHVIQRCKSASVEYAEMIYRGTDCQNVPTAEWLADIPEQQGNK